MCKYMGGFFSDSHHGSEIEAEEGSSKYLVWQEGRLVANQASWKDSEMETSL